MSVYEDSGDEGPTYDFLYVEDDYGIADDLAEHAIASPVLTLEDGDGSEYDLFDYFNDVEYLSDSGWNDGCTVRDQDNNTLGPTSGRKRKISIKQTQYMSGGLINASSQQQFHEEPVSPIPTVRFRRAGTRSPKPPTLDTEVVKTYTAFKNWREKYACAKGFPIFSGVEGDLDIDTISTQSDSGISPIEEVQRNIPSNELGMDDLRSALHRTLANSGVLPKGIDETTLLKFVARMLSGDGNADDIAGQLTDDLLGPKEDDATAVGIGAWISQIRDSEDLGDGENDIDGRNLQHPSSPSSDSDKASHSVAIPEDGNNQPPTRLINVKDNSSPLSSNHLRQSTKIQFSDTGVSSPQIALKELLGPMLTDESIDASELVSTFPRNRYKRKLEILDSNKESSRGRKRFAYSPAEQSRKS
ncbi:hypothetical protein M501DRAFT_985214 [Patellaria atrata CBS 101060]|uniref:Uncharacterized protein n=1 Tax=Patellaria atrata CBS 101060 TaxID=1346257 RepID=A0A9P4SID5_9PEZI|nr:hypothetical protein M501DRAFT_985214 [Patellaria atrata CBS 101060]